MRSDSPREHISHNHRATTPHPIPHLHVSLHSIPRPCPFKYRGMHRGTQAMRLRPKRSDVSPGLIGVPKAGATRAADWLRRGWLAGCAMSCQAAWSK